MPTFAQGTKSSKRRSLTARRLPAPAHLFLTIRTYPVSDISSGDVSSAREASEPQAPTSVAAGDMPNSPVREAVIALRADVNLLAEEIAKLAKRRTLSAGVTFQATLCNALRDRIREKPLEAAIGLIVFGYALGRRSGSARKH
jgi:hypothetical protein